MTFDAFVRARGFDPAQAGPFYRRMFVDCWAEPGFHRFWRLWNPVFGYGLWRLYVLLGGNTRPLAASLVVFVACGALLHDLPVALVTGRVSLASCVAFAAFWGLASVNRALARQLDQASWPVLLRVAFNAACVVSGLALGAVAG